MGGPFSWDCVHKYEEGRIRGNREKRLGKEFQPDPEGFVGLAFSGGGIRSATFNLGVRQELENLGLFKFFDYLSTVSGGGYTGSWLLGYLKRGTVTEAASIHHLRQYSRYLAPQAGVFNADTWTIFAVWLRNALLVQTILICFLSALLLLPRFAQPLFACDWLRDHSTVVFRMSLACLLAAAAFISWDLQCIWRAPQELEETSRKRFGWPWFRAWVRSQTGLQFTVVLLLIFSGILGAAALWTVIKYSRDELLRFYGYSATATIGLVTVALSLGSMKAQVPWYGKGFLALVSGLATAALCFPLLDRAAVLFGWLHNMKSQRGEYWAPLAGPPLILAGLALLVVLTIGLLGRQMDDLAREWWSRLGAWLIIYSTALAALALVSVHGPGLLDWLGSSVGGWLGSAVKRGAVAGWIATTLAGILAGKSSETGDCKNPKLELVAAVAPYVFITGLLLVLSYGLNSLPGMSGTTPVVIGTIHLANPNWQAPALALLIVVAVGLFLGFRFDVNEFSMNHFYRNRLVRCYLGASRKRAGDPFTDFDPDDDIRLSKFEAAYAGPYPIINTAINSSAGSDLDVQDRRAESFFFTPGFCGFYRRKPGDQPEDTVRFRKTVEYADPDRDGLSLGTLVSISGAAASPNMGFHTSSAIAFLMTVFNVRMGWWLPNPLESKWRKPSPAFGFEYFLYELLASATLKDKFVYLSDGGHFENLGVYELIRRRCRVIIACDAEQDGNYQFESLGGLIRKCQVDFGAHIDIDVNEIRTQNAAGFNNAHCAVGRIRYTEPDAADGTLIYLKASLTGDEETDILQFKATSATFPRETTEDQFFTEPQFESYRKLGQHITREALEKAVVALGKQPDPRSFMRNFARNMQDIWHMPAHSASASFVHHAESFAGILREMRTDTDLAFLDAQMIPEWQQVLKAFPRQPLPNVDPNLWLPANPAIFRKAFYLCQSIIQLMENVYLDLKLVDDNAHPDNRGWMNLFHHWSHSGMFRVTWEISKSTFGRRFQSFCEQELGLAQSEIRIEPTSKESPKLNSYERGLIKKALAQLKNDSRIYVFGFQVSNPANENDAVDLYFGFAIICDAKLEEFRIQDHLRRTGLARLAVDKLKQEFPGLAPAAKFSKENDKDEQHPKSPEELEYRAWVRRKFQ
jgi:hypothetical protein